MKKFLSLVLSLVMALSLVTVSAGAADFEDDGDITYQEAVNVIAGIGVVDGYSDGTFNPDGVLTRGAAAKIICNLILGPTTADALSADSAPFRDVPTTNTFAGYITYCSQQGIINGYSDGTFRPTGTLSGNAFMKMLLGALGYDSSIEGYTGANWTVNVIKQAVGIGLDDGNDEFVGSQAVTREEAALYAYNMLQATMVEYDSSNTIIVGDVQVTTSSSRHDMENNANRETVEDDDKMQFAERYFEDLVGKDAVDDFGRPATNWDYDGEDLGTYAKDADATYVVEDDDLTVEEVVTSSDYMNYRTSEVSNAEYFLNGDDNEIRSNAAVALGDIVEAYENDDGDVETVVVRRYTVARIDEVDTDVSTAESRNGASAVLTLTSLDSNSDYGDYYDDYDEAEDTLRGYTSAYDEGTILAVAFREADSSSGEVLDSYVAESVTGAVSAYRQNETVTLDGSRYEFVRDDTDVYVDGAVDGFDFDEDYTIYLTAEGYVIGVEGAAGADLTDVYYVAGVYGEESRYNSGNFTWYAQAVSLEDGSVTDIELDEEDGYFDVSDNWQADSNPESDLHRYISDSADATNAGDYVQVQGLYTFDDDITEVWNGGSSYDVSSNITLSKDIAADDTRFSTSGGTFYVDDTTQFLGVDDEADDIDTVLTSGGIKATGTGSEKVIVVTDDSDTRDAVYVVLVDCNATAGSADVLYTAGSSYDRVGSDEYVCEFWFMDDNTSEEISADERYSKGFYEVDEIDADGIYTLSGYDDVISSGTINDDSDGIAVEGLTLNDSDRIYRSALTGSIDGITFDDVSIANATIIDARSNSTINSSVYDRAINSISRLTAAVEAVEELDEPGTVVIDLYARDGEITFICVQSVNGEGETETPVDADHEFDSLRATISASGSSSNYDTIEFTTATCDEISGWKLNDVKVEYVVSVDGDEYDTFTNSLSTISSFSDLASDATMKIDGLAISSGDHTITVDVLMSFTGNNGASYTVSGTATIRTA